MNLYLFNANDIAAAYGIGTYLKELTRALEGTGIHIHVVHLHATCPEFKIEKENQVENCYIPDVRNLDTFNGSMKMLEMYCGNVIYMLRLNIKDAKDLIFHINFNHYHFFAKELKSVFECKIVTTVHFMKWMIELQGNLSLLHTIQSKPKEAKNPYEQWISRTFENETLLYKEADQVIALAHYTQDILQKENQIDSKKITLIPNGLEDIHPKRTINKAELRKKWRLSEKESIILFVGRLYKEKGLEFLLGAFRKLLEKIPDCRLIIAGNGHYHIYLEECKDIWAKVSWTGWIDKESLYELYSIADIGIMPSFHEQCSYVAIEMMRHGLPIIGSTSTGLNEMIIEGETGLHIPVIELADNVLIDTSLLSEKMQFLLQHPKELQRIGQNARKHYENHYSRDDFRKNMLKFYYSLFDSMPSPLISVITPVYNAGKELCDTIQSVLNQTYQNFEMIIVDDGSETDITPYIQQFNDNRLIYYKLEHKNANVARNLGITRSKGEYIAMLDADDVWLPSHLEDCLDTLQKTHADGLYGSVFLKQDNGNETPVYVRQLYEGEKMINYILSLVVGAQTSSLFLTKESAIDILWDEMLNHHQGCDFVVRYHRKYKLTHKAQPTVKYTCGDQARKLDYQSCIRFIKNNRKDIAHQLYNKYHLQMLTTAKHFNVSPEIIRHYKKEATRYKSYLSYELYMSIKNPQTGYLKLFYKIEYIFYFLCGRIG